MSEIKKTRSYSRDLSDIFKKEEEEEEDNKLMFKMEEDDIDYVNVNQMTSYSAYIIKN